MRGSCFLAVTVFLIFERILGTETDSCCGSQWLPNDILLSP